MKLDLYWTLLVSATVCFLFCWYTFNYIVVHISFLSFYKHFLNRNVAYPEKNNCHNTPLPPHNGHLSTIMATFLCFQFDHCGMVLHLFRRHHFHGQFVFEVALFLYRLEADNQLYVKYKVSLTNNYYRLFSVLFFLCASRSQKLDHLKHSRIFLYL